MLWNYLQSKYVPDEPIILSEINIPSLSPSSLRRSIKRLTDTGKLNRYDDGVYFIPKYSVLKSGSQLSREKVIERKYLLNENGRFGYISGCVFANKMGLTTQVPMVREIVTNKATTQRRETELTGAKLIIRKPKAYVTDENYAVLQFLDLIKDIDIYSELTGKKLTECLLTYAEKAGITMNDADKYIGLYPDKLYRNLYETGVFYGLFTL